MQVECPECGAVDEIDNRTLRKGVFRWTCPECRRASDVAVDREEALARAREGDPDGIAAAVELIRSSCHWSQRHHEDAERIDGRWDPTDSEDRMVYDRLLAGDAGAAARETLTEGRDLAAALATVGHPLALEALMELSSDPNPLVGETAAWGLAHAGVPQAVGPLLRVLKQAVVEGDKKRITKITRALERVGSAGMIELAAGLSDDNSIVRWTAATILADVGDSSVVAALTAASADPSDAVREAAGFALERIAERSQ